MTIIVEMQGAVICAYDNEYHPPTHNRKIPRGVISEMSRKARRRLMIELNQMDYTNSVRFMTLTFHAIPTLAECNRAFSRFRAWLRRTYPDSSAIWRREFQPRRGSYHFHLLWFNAQYIPQAALQAVWTRCTGEDRSIVDIRRVKSREHAMRYVSKYVAKLPEAQITTSLELSPYSDDHPKRSIGRTWGYINSAGLPFAEAFVAACLERGDAAVVWIAAQEETGQRCGHNPHVVIMFGSDIGRIWRFLQREGRIDTEIPPHLGKLCYSRTQPG